MHPLTDKAAKGLLREGHMRNILSTAEKSLTARAAWLHYVGGLKQSEVAKTLGVPSVKAHRMIARAVSEGIVKVSIDDEIIECIELGNRLAKKYSLNICEVAPDLIENDDLPLRALGNAGADFIRRHLELGNHKLIGIGHGRTLAAAIRQLPRVDTKGAQFVSLLGGLTRNFAANPHDVMHLIAEKTSAQAYVVPVPFFANTSEDRQVLFAQKGIKDIFDIGQSATLKLVGIGTVGPETQLVRSGMIESSEINEVVKKGAVGELLGHFYSKEGKLLETMLTSRTLAISVDEKISGEVVALAGGSKKVDPLRAVLESGRLTGLITDELTAKALVSG